MRKEYKAFAVIVLVVLSIPIFLFAYINISATIKAPKGTCLNTPYVPSRVGDTAKCAINIKTSTSYFLALKYNFTDEDRDHVRRVAIEKRVKPNTDQVYGRPYLDVKISRVDQKDSPQLLRQSVTPQGIIAHTGNYAISPLVSLHLERGWYYVEVINQAEAPDFAKLKTSITIISQGRK